MRHWVRITGKWGAVPVEGAGISNGTGHAAWIHSTRLHLVLYSFLLVYTPFILLQNYLVDLVSEASRSAFGLGTLRVPVVPIAAGVLLLLGIIRFRRSITRRMLAASSIASDGRRRLSSSSSTTPARSAHNAAAPPPRLVSRSSTVIIWMLLVIWALLLVFGVVSMSNPERLETLARKGRNAEADAYKHLGDNELKNGNAVLAIAQYLHALSISAEQPDVLLNLGIAFLRRGDLARSAPSDLPDRETRLPPYPANSCITLRAITSRWISLVPS